MEVSRWVVNVDVQLFCEEIRKGPIRELRHMAAFHYEYVIEEKYIDELDFTCIL